MNKETRTFFLGMFYITISGIALALQIDQMVNHVWESVTLNWILFIGSCFIFFNGYNKIKHTTF